MGVTDARLENLLPHLAGESGVVEPEFHGVLPSLGTGSRTDLKADQMVNVPPARGQASVLPPRLDASEPMPKQFRRDQSRQLSIILLELWVCLCHCGLTQLAIQSQLPGSQEARLVTGARGLSSL